MNRLILVSAFLFSGLFFFNACNPNKKAGESVKFQQYYVEGEQLYIANCSNCHQKSGTGLGLIYPPLNESDFMNENLDQVICLMKYGRSGELIVNGKNFNQPMPGVPTLTELELAEIATYIYNTWTHEKGIVDLPTVKQALQNCKAP